MTDKPTVVELLLKVMAGRVRVAGNGCIEWTGYVLRSGYGQLMRGRRRYVAHRLAYESLVGPVPSGLVLDHLCRNKVCLNPAHLEPVTEQVNILRGTAPAAVNAAKTHCESGHPFDDANTYWRPTGGRMCRACAIDAKRRFRERRRAA